jgi:hypothetical protein
MKVFQGADRGLTHSSLLGQSEFDEQVATQDCTPHATLPPLEVPLG